MSGKDAGRSNWTVTLVCAESRTAREAYVGGRAVAGSAE